MGAGWQLSEPGKAGSGERGDAWAREARPPLGADFHAASHAPCASRPRGPPPPRSPPPEGQAGAGRKTRASGPVQTPAARPAGRRLGRGVPSAPAGGARASLSALALGRPHQSAAPSCLRPRPRAAGRGRGGGNGRKGSRGVHAPAPAPAPTPARPAGHPWAVLPVNHRALCCGSLRVGRRK